MFRTSIIALALSMVDLITSSPHHTSHQELLVKTNAFAAKGTVWPNNTATHFYGNIPYAEPPVGELRWRPPVTKVPSSDVINGSWFGPSCVQYSSGKETVYSEYLTGFLISPGQSQSEGMEATQLKERCADWRYFKIVSRSTSGPQRPQRRATSCRL